MRVTALILAGGRGQRMGGEDKGLVNLNDKKLIDICLKRIRPQVDEIMISANRNLDYYHSLGMGVVEDIQADYPGPLAGMFSGLAACKTSWMLTLPCDSPFFPDDLLIRMQAKRIATQADIVSVSDGQRSHPVFALMDTQLQASLQSFMQSGQRKIDRWFAGHNYQLADFSDQPEAFANINTPQELLDAQERQFP